MRKIIFPFPMISCGHCAKTIQTKIARGEGVLSVTADASKNTSVKFDAPASESSIRSQLAALHFLTAL